VIQLKAEQPRRRRPRRRGSLRPASLRDWRLKDRSILPISRYTENTVSFEWSAEEAMPNRVVINPVAGFAFTRLTAIECRRDAARLNR
jgi:hypothetical protein